MPKFLEKVLKAEATKKGKTGRAAARYVYGAMNNMGAMHGNKETAKGARMEAKHVAKMQSTTPAKGVKVTVPSDDESDVLAPSRSGASRARQSVRTGKNATKSSFPKQKAAKGQTNAWSFRNQTTPIKVPKAAKGSGY